jgi:hypothetical protein
MEGEIVAGTLPDEAGVHDDAFFSEDQEGVDAAHEIKAYLNCGETLKALITCNRMLSLHPGNKLFEGLRLEIENKEREVRLESIRQLSADLEHVPDLDARIEAIQQALHRYPTESQLSQLLKNAIARRDLFNSLVTEARNEELADGYSGALKRWYLIRELYPGMPGLELQIHRVESLAESQKKMKRRAEFVDAIFQLSSTGDYARAVYQCINALSEFPNDGGLLTLKKTVEEKAQHSTELQTLISEGVTFLQSRHVDAALESFGKAKAFDQSNLQVRYLIGIALLEKARAVMSNDRRKLNALLEEARSFIPNSELKTLSFESEENAENDERWETSLVRVTHPADDLQYPDERASDTPIVVTPPPQASPEVPPLETPQPSIPDPVRGNESSQRVVLVTLVLLAAFIIGWLVYVNRPRPEPGPVAPAPSSVDIKATPEGAEIFMDSQKLGVSQIQARLAPGTHTVTVSLAGYDSQTFPLELSTEPRALQVDLRPALGSLFLKTDQTAGTIWMDDQIQGEITESGDITISGVKPGVRLVKMQTPANELEFSVEFQPGKIPVARSLPPRQIANVFFAGSADGKSHVECNCAPAGLRIGELAQMIRPGGFELPLIEGEHRAELWLGKSRKNLKVQGSRSPVATIAVFSSVETQRENRTESSRTDSDRHVP